MTAALRPYATTPQTDTTHCLVCNLPSSRDTPFVAVLTPTRGKHHWLHAGACHVEHSARCRAERDAATHPCRATTQGAYP